MAKETTEETKVKEKTYRPGELAVELEVDAKRIRAWLRQEYTRDLSLKNSSWHLDEETAQAVRDHFQSDEDEEETEEVDEELVTAEDLEG